MNNRKYYAFERNNYYYGKLLTCSDFQSEQSYMNSKRRLLSKTINGSGIVYGLGVVAADDSSLILQSGLALDGAGREITVGKTQVLKLSTLKGYDNIQTDTILLGIAYNEENNDPVYGVMSNDSSQEAQYNHVKEGYTLFLQDSRDVIKPTLYKDRFIKEQVIYSDEDATVAITAPTFVVAGKNVKLIITITKNSHAPCILSLETEISSDKFKQKSVPVAASNLSLEYGEVHQMEVTLTPEEYIFGNEDVAIALTGISIVKSGVKNTVNNMELVVSPVSGSILNYVHQASYKGTLDAYIDETYDEKLWIAKIHLLRSNSRALIDQVDTAPFDQYVCTADQLMNLQLLQEYLPEEAGAVAAQMPVRTAASAPVSNVEASGNNRQLNSSGVFEMSLGEGGEAGKVYYSEEIMHGLGSGPVYVEIGIEYIARSESGKGNKESIILGDGSIFAADNSITEEKIFQVDQAVRILPDRGTFIVGVRPKTKMGKIGLRIRWYAFKPEDLEHKVYSQKEQKGCIMIQPDTIVVAPKGSVHIEPVFINMPEEPLTYTLLDAEGGKVDNNGLYTAPAQEGIYEVRVEAMSNPEIFSHAFLIVSAKKN